MPAATQAAPSHDHAKLTLPISVMKIQKYACNKVI